MAVTRSSSNKIKHDRLPVCHRARRVLNRRLVPSHTKPIHSSASFSFLDGGPLRVPRMTAPAPKSWSKDNVRITIRKRRARMKKTQFTEEPIAYALHEGEAGTPVADICRKLGVSEQTFYRWKKKFAGMGVAELRR